VEEALKGYFFKNFGGNRQEAYRPVECGFVGWGLPDFWIRIIVATFHRIGKYPMCIAALKSCIRYFTAVGGNSCRIFPVMRSYPVGTFNFRVIDDGLYLRSSEPARWRFELMRTFQF
jgi:hypothetical protein